MVGGGDLSSFANEKKIDEELFVRWAQVNALMGMMQMSLSPWRVLNEESTNRVIAALKLHAAMGEEIYALVQNASVTGEPIVRSIAYVYPNAEFETITDQFMLDEKYLVAPVITPKAVERIVVLHEGNWLGWNQQKYTGGQTISVSVTMDDLPYFVSVDHCLLP